MLNIIRHQGNENSHNEISLNTSYLSEQLSSKKQKQKTAKKKKKANTVEDVEKREPSYVVGRNINWCSHCGKQYRGFSLKIEVPYNSTISLLAIYLKKY